MNRIDFVGNALFIPFFLISVGMLVDVTMLVKGWGALRVAGIILFVALATKYLAAWLTQRIFKLTATEGKMIFGLSASHAAATLAIILVGYNIITGETASGEPIRLLNEDVLNGTIILILVSCGVSSFVVEDASKKMALDQDQEDTNVSDEQINEKILVSLAYPDMVTQLVDFGVMLKSKKAHAPIYGLNVIDDEGNNTLGASRKILEKAVSHAAASENNIIPVTRYDSSISNGIVYTIKEYEVSDIVIGLHKKSDQHTFLGTKAENIIRRVHETIYIYRPTQPLNTFKRIVVAMPPKAETEPGFLHWLKKLMMIAKEAGIAVNFYGTPVTNHAIEKIIERSPDVVKINFNEFGNWDDFLIFSRELKANDLFIIVSSRKGHNSHIPQLNKLPYYLSNYFLDQSLIILYPKQLESGINMGDIEQADSNLIETISEQIGAIGKAGKYIKDLFTNR
ncbi:cation:proton antiporter [Pedobacter frigoris]|uniref:cation:proton antiporter n=1 Tax=Pedobacter frigoris TaxID=2571272 RepID=UPI0021CEF8CB|nr:cation:proton antiporter [Pedobacter frigoris]